MVRSFSYAAPVYCWEVVIRSVEPWNVNFCLSFLLNEFLLYRYCIVLRIYPFCVYRICFSVSCDLVVLVLLSAVLPSDWLERLL